MDWQEIARFEWLILFVPILALAIWESVRTQRLIRADRAARAAARAAAGGVEAPGGSADRG
jgi:hypothetical protein